MAGYRAIALTVATASFVQYLDATALNTAIPTIARDLHVPAVSLNLAILSYQVALVVCIPFGNIAAERIGPRNAFALSLFAFMCGSILCAMSNSLPTLTAARAIQGMGGAIMLPVGRVLVVRSAAKSELISAMNWLLVPGILGPILGPAVGGFIVTYASWQWIFLVNIPIALLGIAMTFALMSPSREAPTGRFDLIGVLMISPAIFGFIFGLESATRPDAGLLTAVLLSGSMLLGLIYVRHARSVTAPVIDLSLFSIPSFRHSMISGMLLRIVFGAIGFLLPLWFQLVMRMTAIQAGTLMVMVPVGALLSRFIGGILLRHSHPRSVAVYSVATLVILLIIGATLTPDWPLPLFYTLLGCQGLTLSITMMVVSAVSYADVVPERVAAATSLYITLQQLTLSLGVTTGVWTIAIMRWVTGATPHDNRSYVGSMLALALIAFAALVTTRKLDTESTGSLRPKKATEAA